jgi:hypothetical protein
VCETLDAHLAEKGQPQKLCIVARMSSQIDNVELNVHQDRRRGPGVDIFPDGFCLSNGRDQSYAENNRVPEMHVDGMSRAQGYLEFILCGKTRGRSESSRDLAQIIFG